MSEKELHTSNSHLPISPNSTLPASDFQLRSEEVQEILTRVPNWMIRWGTVVITMVLFLLLFSTWFIKYPDIVTAPIVITTNIPPEKLVAKVSGKIEAILVNDKTKVLKYTPLAVIENSADYVAVLELSQELQAYSDLPEGVALSNIINNFRTANLGEVQQAFAIFQKEYSADQLNTKLQPYQVEGTAQGYEGIQLKEQLSLLESQKSINQNELALQKSDLERYDGLFRKGIVAAQELDRHKLTYLQVERNYKSLLSTISQLKSSLNELNRNSKTTQINENKENVNLQRNVIQAFYGLKKAIKDWELNYVLRSSVDGRVSFLQLWAANQTVNAGDNVFAVIPTNESGYIGKLKAPALNSGKIRVGQQVNIRLANFPDSEYGMLRGVIKNISLTPDKDGNVLMDVALPKKLETSYHKTITFQQEMSGSAEIVTEDLRLAERLLYQFRNVFRR
jgi:multidrug resistance efflux pump